MGQTRAHARILRRDVREGRAPRCPAVVGSQAMPSSSSPMCTLCCGLCAMFFSEAQHVVLSTLHYYCCRVTCIASRPLQEEGATPVAINCVWAHAGAQPPAAQARVHDVPALQELHQVNSFTAANHQAISPNAWSQGQKNADAHDLAMVTKAGPSPVVVVAQFHHPAQRY